MNGDVVVGALKSNKLVGSFGIYWFPCETKATWRKVKENWFTVSILKQEAELRRLRLIGGAV